MKVISKEDILELYVIELQPECWSICSTLSETKETDTPRTLCFGSAEVYRNQSIADRHCNNIIKGGKFINAKVVKLEYLNAPLPLDSEVEEAILDIANVIPFKVLRTINDKFDTIRQALSGKDITITKLTKTITLMTKDLNELNDLNDILEHTNNYLIDVREHNHNLMR